MSLLNFIYSVLCVCIFKYFICILSTGGLARIIPVGMHHIQKSTNNCVWGCLIEYHYVHPSTALRALIKKSGQNYSNILMKRRVRAL